MARRVLVAVVAGICAAWWVWYRYSPAYVATHDVMVSDFDHLWFGARALWRGKNPYELIGPGRAFDWPWTLRYPLPALLVVTPLTPFPLGVARATFAGISAAVLAFAITRDGESFRLPLLLSLPFAFALIRGQWSPLLLAGFYWAPASLVNAAKPSLGAACFAARPRRATFILGCTLVVLSFWLQPAWVSDWTRALRGGTSLTPVFDIVGGPLALIALLRWRRPEGRLIAFTALVPQTFIYYEVLYVFAAASTRLEVITLALASHASYLIGLTRPLPPDLVGVMQKEGPLIIVCLYLPALLMLLRRPNEGPVSAWMERFARRLPEWLRGCPSAGMVER